MQIQIPDSDSMEAFGAALAANLAAGTSVFLIGELGAGKTTLVRGFLHALGHRGAVKSPTYTLVEPYELAGVCIYHFDLYRLNDPEELEYMGIRDYMSQDAIRLIEWPQQGGDFLGAADLTIEIAYQDTGRQINLTAHNQLTAELCESLNA